MRIRALTRVNADVGGTVVKLARDEEADVPDAVARVLIKAEQAEPAYPHDHTHHFYGTVGTSNADSLVVHPKGASVLIEIRDRALAGAKAIAAVVAPIATTAALDALVELSTSTDVGVAAIATGLLVWLVPNKARR